MGRFTTVDEWAGDINNPISLNKYLYGYGNPGSYVDPDGRRGCDSMQCTLLQARERASSPEQRSSIDALRAGDAASKARAGDLSAGLAVGAAESAILGAAEGAQALADTITAPIEAVTGVDFGARERNAARLSGASTGLVDLYEDPQGVALAPWNQATELAAQGRFYEAGKAASPYAAALAGSVGYATSRVARMGAPSKVIAEGADGQLATRLDAVSECCDRCFGAGTLVMTAGGRKPIEDVTVGERVMARDEVSGETELRTVEHVIVRNDREVFELTFADGEQREVISVTSDHRFHTTERGWVVSAELQIGEAIESLDGRRLVFETRSAQARKAPTFNLSVAEDHNYFVGESGLWVHNCTPCGPTSSPVNTAVKSTSQNSAELSRNLTREGRDVLDGQAAGHRISVNDAANDIPIGHPTPHNVMHNRAFHTGVESRLKNIESSMRDGGYGRKAIRSALRSELRSIGNEVLESVE